MFTQIKKAGLKDAAISRRLGQGFLCLILVGLMGSGEAAPMVKEVNGVARVFGDGEKVSEVILTYSEPLLASSVSPKDYVLSKGTLESVQVARSLPPFKAAEEGRYVILKVKTENTVPETLLAAPQKERTEKMRQEPKLDGHSDRKAPDLSIAVRQVGEVTGAKGDKSPGSIQFMASTRTLEPDLSRFTQKVFTDPETGISLPYSLYLPKKIKQGEKLPLVYFGVDMSGNNDDFTTPLYQGNGATIWTDPAFQAKHPSIVVAPQYTSELVTKLGMLTADDHQWTKGLTLLKHFLDYAVKTYPVDPNRIYGTGQSQGGMANIAISDRYPDFFAAQYLVACQWDPKKMQVLKDKPLWITVCEGDNKAYPAMNETTALWEKADVKVARNATLWDSTLPVGTLNAKMEQLLQPDTHIYYTVFKGGNHMYTWSFAYSYDAIREWLFSQAKEK
jgi:predicted peptidase